MATRPTVASLQIEVDALARRVADLEAALRPPPRVIRQDGGATLRQDGRAMLREAA